MLILEYDVLEVILNAFMDHLKPAVNGEFQKLAMYGRQNRSCFAYFIFFSIRWKNEIHVVKVCLSLLQYFEEIIIKLYWTLK